MQCEYQAYVDANVMTYLAGALLFAGRLSTESSSVHCSANTHQTNGIDPAIVPLESHAGMGSMVQLSSVDGKAGLYRTG